MNIHFNTNSIPSDSQEWLLSNSRGDYASGSVSGCNARRYHGLLAAQAENGKYMLLSSGEDSIIINDKEFPLSTRYHPGILWPEGWKWESEFRCSHDEISRVFHLPLPSGGETLLKRSVRLCRNACRIIIRYELLGSMPAQAEIVFKPLAACRQADYLLQADTSRAEAFQIQECGPAACSLEAGGDIPRMSVQISGASSSMFSRQPDWYYHVLYPTEKLRGYDWEEDLFMPGIFRTVILPGKPVYFTAGTDLLEIDPERLWENEEKEEKDFSTNSVSDHLSRECRRFLIRINGRPSIPAGYHWFGPWGRDTLIALPGLAFYSGNREYGKEILKSIAASIRSGLVPNLLESGNKTPSFNSADASLWYLLAVQRLADFQEEDDFVLKECWPSFKDIIRHFSQGTMPGDHGNMLVQADSDGLLHAGTPQTQLTWMDASVDGIPVTPRHGCAVELNAIWYNALAFALKYALAHGESAPAETSLLPRLKQAFRRTFIPSDSDPRMDGGLYDSWSPSEGASPHIRPNQIIAAAMPYSPLTLEKRRRIIACVKKHLLTPFGLRTLSPSDPAYQPFCRGDQRERDKAYHQGTVWPWLLGFYAEALLLSGASQAKLKEFLNTIAPLCTSHLNEAGLGCISEIFDGDPPHASGGCIAQAWSTAELFRIFILLKRAHPALTEKWLDSHPLTFA